MHFTRRRNHFPPPEVCFSRPEVRFSRPEVCVSRPEVRFSRPEVRVPRLIALLQQFVAAVEATKSSNAVWRSDVQADRAMELMVAPVRAGLKSILQGKFGKSGTQLLKFGITPLKAPVKTTAVKTAAVAKSKATREARGTKGSVQKKEIVGNVTGVVITPMTAGPTVPVTTQNAASSSGGAVVPAPSPTPTPAPTGGTPPHS